MRLVFSSDIFLIQWHENDDARRYDCEDHHEIDACSPGEQDVAQREPQQQDAGETYDVSSRHKNYVSL